MDYKKYATREYRDKVNAHRRHLRKTNPTYLLKSRLWNRNSYKNNKHKPNIIRSRREYGKKYKSTNPRRALWHKIGCKINYMVRSGRLNRLPCEVYGKTKVQAHHDDYRKPFSVRWLCHEHHSDLHVIERKQLTLSQLKNIVKQISLKQRTKGEK